MPDFFQIIDDRGCRVIELTMPAGADASEFDRINQRALTQIGDTSGEGWILDLADFEYVGSAALGFMINVRQRVKSSGGLLVVCGVSDSIEAILRTSSLGRLFQVVDERDDAIAAIEAWRKKQRKR